MAVLSGPIFAGFELARRLENAEAESARLWVEAYLRHIGPDAAFEPAGGGIASFTGVVSPLSHATGVGMNGPVSDGDMDRLEAFYRSRGAVPNIDLCPLAHPSLLEQVARRGYRPVEYNNILLKVDDGWDRPPAGIEVRPVADCEAWTQVVLGGFFERDQFSQPERELGEMMFRMKTVTPWIAFQEGQPAAAGHVRILGPIGLLACDGTPPAFRRRGLQRALIAARVRQAAEAGCELITAATCPGTVSQRNYERCGFRVMYTKINIAR